MQLQATSRRRHRGGSQEPGIFPVLFPAQHLVRGQGQHIVEEGGMPPEPEAAESVEIQAAAL